MKLREVFFQNIIKNKGRNSDEIRDQIENFIKTIEMTKIKGFDEVLIKLAKDLLII